MAGGSAVESRAIRDPRIEARRAARMEKEATVARELKAFDSFMLRSSSVGQNDKETFRRDRTTGERLSRYSSLRSFAVKKDGVDPGDHLAKRRSEEAKVWARRKKVELEASGRSVAEYLEGKGGDGEEESDDEGLDEVVKEQRRKVRAGKKMCRDKGMVAPRDFQKDEIRLCRARRLAEAEGKSFYSVPRPPPSPEPEREPEPEGVTRLRDKKPGGVLAILEELRPKPLREGEEETEEKRIERIAYEKARVKVIKSLGVAPTKPPSQKPFQIDHLWGLKQTSRSHFETENAAHYKGEQE